MNQFVVKQCENMKKTVEIFQQSVKMAAFEDDGVLSKEEQKAIEIINKASENFLKELAKAVK